MGGVSASHSQMLASNMGIPGSWDWEGQQPYSCH